jgi:hypothetical protein
MGAPDDIMRPATTSEMRKASPIASGPLAYFPASLELVSRLCKAANEKHNPGQPMHWSRDKSTDHADCEVRHLLESGTIDPEFGLDHAVGRAWRALADLQLLAETKYGWPKAPAAKGGDVPVPASIWYRSSGNLDYLYEKRTRGAFAEYRAVARSDDGSPLEFRGSWHVASPEVTMTQYVKE